MADMEPGIKKYAVTIMNFRVGDLPDAPNPEWIKRDAMVYDNDITQIFDGFRKEIKGSKDEPRPDQKFIRFVPKGVKGLEQDSREGPEVVVYFNPADKRSMYVVAKLEEHANTFIKGLGFGLKGPYPEARQRKGFHSLY